MEGKGEGTRKSWIGEVRQSTGMGLVECSRAAEDGASMAKHDRSLISLEGRRPAADR